MSDARAHDHQNDRNANTHHHRSRGGIRRELSPYAQSFALGLHALVISTAYRDVPRPTTSSQSSTKLAGSHEWLRRRLRACDRCVAASWQLSTSFARDAPPWYAACSRVGSLYKRPVRRRFTVMDNGKASEGIFRWAPLRLGIIREQTYAGKICRRNMYIFHVYMYVNY